MDTPPWSPDNVPVQDIPKKPTLLLPRVFAVVIGVVVLLAVILLYRAYVLRNESAVPVDGVNANTALEDGKIHLTPEQIKMRDEMLAQIANQEKMKLTQTQIKSRSQTIKNSASDEVIQLTPEQIKMRETILQAQQ
jgi:hypothetical protein